MKFEFDSTNAHEYKWVFSIKYRFENEDIKENKYEFDVPKGLGLEKVAERATLKLLIEMFSISNREKKKIEITEVWVEWVDKRSDPDELKPDDGSDDGFLRGEKN